MIPGSNGVSIPRATLAGLPKVELHRHLEGALRLATMYEIATQYDLGLPTRSVEELRPYVQIMKGEPDSRSFLDKFNYLRRFYQSPELIHRLAYEAVEDAAQDNVRYLELRFTPKALANTHNYPLAEVTDWVIEAAEQACQKFPQMQVWLIANVNRHEPVELAEEVIQIAVDRKSRGIVAVDIGGDEVKVPFPAQPFVSLFREAKRAGLGITIHAGEWAGPASVRNAIENLGADRIGHGVRVVEDPAVVALARERGTVFEVCLTSNLQTGVVQQLANHPLREMRRQGLKTTLNTDDPSIFQVALTDECELAIAEVGLRLPEIHGALLTAVNSTFIPPAERAKLLKQFEAELQQMPTA